MAVRFRPLPLDIFSETQRPYIRHMNEVLTQLTALEGAIRTPRKAKRSDASVVRRDDVQVDVSRISPSIVQVVSGQSTAVGTPALVLGTVNTIGSTTTAVSINSAVALFGTQTPHNDATSASVGTSAFAARADHSHQFPTTLQSSASQSTLTLTDDTINQTISGSLGNLIVNVASGTTITISDGIRVDLPSSTTAQIVVAPPTGGSGASVLASLQGKAGIGTQTVLSANWTSGNPTPSSTLRSWDGAMNLAGGQSYTTNTFVPYDLSTFTVNPGSGSDANLTAYGARFAGPLVSSGNGGWLDIGALYLTAPRRVISNPSLSQGNCLIVECPTIGDTAQAGIYIKQRAAQKVALSRYGILIDAQNSGTTRYAIYGVSDILYHGGNIQHAGNRIGFYNVGTGATQSTGWSVSNITATKTLNGSSFTLNDVMNTLGTLLTYLQVRGDVGP